MRTKLIALVLAALAAAVALPAQAQGRRGLRINEVMVANDSSSVTDDYGNYSAWVELFNSTFAPLEISSVYLTDDKANPKKYPVPLGDVNTEIPTRQHVLFFADGHPNRGTFHTNFTLRPGQTNYIAIFDADGATLIDEVEVPATLLPGQSYARAEDGGEGWEVRDGSASHYITPSGANRIKDTNDKIEMFAQHDPDGFAMALMAMGIVFSALLVLSTCFYCISKIGEKAAQRRKAQALGQLAPAKAAAAEAEHDNGEEIAAIAMALAEHFDAHDSENPTLTIKKLRRAYSPWSSKFYGVYNNTPHKN